MISRENQDNRQEKSPALVRSELEGHFYVNRLRLRFDGALEARYRRYCGLRDRRYIRQLVNILIGLPSVFYGVGLIHFLRHTVYNFEIC